VAPSTKELMSYCDPTWLSADYYATLAGRFKREIVVDTAFSANARRDAANSSYVMIAGYAASDGNSGALLNAYPQDTSQGASVTEPGGDYCLNFQASGAVLSQDCFTLDFTGENGESVSN